MVSRFSARPIPSRYRPRQPETPSKSFLGHGFIMPDPETDRGELDHGAEVGRILFGARGDTSAIIDLVEETLDAIAV